MSPEEAPSGAGALLPRRQAGRIGVGQPGEEKVLGPFSSISVLKKKDGNELFAVAIGQKVMVLN